MTQCPITSTGWNLDGLPIYKCAISDGCECPQSDPVSKIVRRCGPNNLSLDTDLMGASAFAFSGDQGFIRHTGISRYYANDSSPYKCDICPDGTLPAMFNESDVGLSVASAGCPGSPGCLSVAAMNGGMCKNNFKPDKWEATTVEQQVKASGNSKLQAKMMQSLYQVEEVPYWVYPTEGDACLVNPMRTIFPSSERGFAYDDHEMNSNHVWGYGGVFTSGKTKNKFCGAYYPEDLSDTLTCNPTNLQPNCVATIAGILNGSVAVDDPSNAQTVAECLWQAGSKAADVIGILPSSTTATPFSSWSPSELSSYKSNIEQVLNQSVGDPSALEQKANIGVLQAKKCASDAQKCAVKVTECVPHCKDCIESCGDAASTINEVLPMVRAITDLCSLTAAYTSACQTRKDITHPDSTKESDAACMAKNKQYATEATTELVKEAYKARYNIAASPVYFCKDCDDMCYATDSSFNITSSSLIPCKQCPWSATQFCVTECAPYVADDEVLVGLSSLNSELGQYCNLAAAQLSNLEYGAKALPCTVRACDKNRTADPPFGLVCDNFDDIGKCVGMGAGKIALEQKNNAVSFLKSTAKVVTSYDYNKAFAEAVQDVELGISQIDPEVVGNAIDGVMDEVAETCVQYINPASTAKFIECMTPGIVDPTSFIG